MTNGAQARLQRITILPLRPKVKGAPLGALFYCFPAISAPEISASAFPAVWRTGQILECRLVGRDYLMTPPHTGHPHLQVLTLLFIP